MHRGYTFIEVAVVITILGVSAAIAVPKLTHTNEQVNVDLAAGRLQTIWNAQRFYWLEHGGYAQDLKDLRRDGLLDEAFASHDERFAFRVDGNGKRFLATATRMGGDWYGALTINEQGRLQGAVRSRGGRRVLP